MPCALVTDQSGGGGGVVRAQLAAGSGYGLSADMPFFEYRQIY